MSNNGRNAIVTASYYADFERCKVLCESIDRHATGYECHYLLIDTPDVELFKQLEGPKRKIITDKQLLPWWLVRIPKVLSPGGRRLWVSPLTVPLHGWHSQQIKRIAVAFHIEQDGLLYCDSDTAFVRSFDLSKLWEGENLRFWHEIDGALTAKSDHLVWQAHAARALGIDPNQVTDDNYVTTFVSWRRQTVVDMCKHMETKHGRSWVSVIGSSRQFSECMLYGAYVDCVLGGNGHAHNETSLCQMYWFDPAPTKEELAATISRLDDGQVGVGVQSFIEMEPKAFRDLILP